MANKVTFDYSKTAEYISEGEITAMKRIAEDAKKLLLSREGEGNDFLGWIDLPVDYDKEEFGRIKKAAELLGIMNVVFFSPEDLSIIKNGPAERRHFVDMELCQLDAGYLYNLNHYNRIVNQRNRLLKDIYQNPSLRDTLSVWDDQMAAFGSQVIERRITFTEQLNDIIGEIHSRLSGGREHLKVVYEPDVTSENFAEALHRNQERDIRLKMTSTGPHRDDFSFLADGVDIRKFGSQGQQRTAALSLKLSEIELVKKMTKDTPVLLLDDVLSELDSNRQNYLLNNISDTQTIITCTGLDEFVRNRFTVNRVFEVIAGHVYERSI